jgi:hypothetical protein
MSHTYNNRTTTKTKIKYTNIFYVIIYKLKLLLTYCNKVTSVTVSILLDMRVIIKF